MKALRFFLVGLLAAPTLALAETRPLTLQDCVDLALGRSPDLQIADLDIAAAGEMVLAAHDALLPSISGRVTAETLWGEPTSNFSLLHIFEASDNPVFASPTKDTSTRITASTTETLTIVKNRFGRTEAFTRVTPERVTSVTTTKNVEVIPGQPVLEANFPALGFGQVSLNYPLYKDGSILGLNRAPAVESAKAHKESLVWTRDLTREQIIFLAASAYLNAAILGEQLRIDTRRVELAERRLPDIREQEKLGLKLPSDVAYSEELLRTSKLSLNLSRAQDASARMQLAVLLGLELGTVTVSHRLPSAPPPPDLKQLLASCRNKHPGIFAEKAVVEQKLQDYRLAHAQLYPQVSLNTNFLYGNDLSASEDQHLYTAGVTVNVPIFDFGTQRAVVRAAQDNYLSEKVRLTKVSDDLSSLIVSDYTALTILRETISSDERLYAASDTAFKLVRSQWQVGLVPELGAIDAELALIDQEEAIQIQRGKELVQCATLQNAAGGVWKWLQ